MFDKYNFKKLSPIDKSKAVYSNEVEAPDFEAGTLEVASIAE